MVASTPSPGLNLLAKQRRRKPVAADGSSREASAESNDDSELEGDDFDTDSLLNEALSTGLPSGGGGAMQGLRGSALGPHGVALTSRDSFDAASATQRTGIQSTAAGGMGRGGAGRRMVGAGGHSVGKAPLTVETDGEGVISEGSAGHDGDISSTTALSGHRGVGGASASSNSSAVSQLPLAYLQNQKVAFASSHAGPSRPDEATTSRMNTAVISSAASSTPPSPHHSPIASRYLGGHAGGSAPPAWAAAPQGFLSNLTPEDIQDHIKTAIATPDPNRAYKIMAPPVGRPVRIYADGVYDLLHYGHMLQLRQCKLAFPSVHLMVGVCSDELVRRYKASPVLTSAERYESVRHCKWVDEVVEDAPWCVDAEFFARHRIDYVAHDEEPYAMVGSDDDVYSYAKSIGAFLPTKRTNGVSTSELLQRIVEGYREGEYDNKFIKLGLPDLCSTRNQSEASDGHGTGLGAGVKGVDEVTATDAGESRETKE